jgi:hypothetical protein
MPFESGDVDDGRRKDRKYSVQPGAETPFDLQVCRGRVKGWSTVISFGKNSDLSIVDEDLWELGGTLVAPTVAGTISTVSSSANDTAAGTGAQTMLIEGLDANYDKISETITLNGLTPVISTLEYLRVNNMLVLTAGSSMYNEGNITSSIGGNPQGYMVAQDAISLQTHYTVPAGHKAYIIEIVEYQGADKTAVSSMIITTPDGVMIRYGDVDTYRVPVHSRLYAAPVGEKHDIKMTARVRSSGTASKQAAFFLYLEKYA